MKAIGIIEVASVAKGIELCDQMIKASDVVIVDALPMCPGKYVIIIKGDTANVKHSVDIAAVEAGAYLVDHLMLANIDEQVFQAVNTSTPVSDLQALGIIETYSVSSCIQAADAAVKAAYVDLIEIRLARGMGGKSFVSLTGVIGSVSAAVAAGCRAAEEEGLLVAYSMIPAPHEDLKRFIF